jgi:hypothetical protein
MLGPAALIANAKQRIPSWNTAGRPKKPRIGTIGFNFRTNNLEYWNGTRWLLLHMIKLNEKTIKLNWGKG